ncbi:hypothetical protein BDV97DRAFT_135760 [Delphinella strobiligena]|nr:hypothetical protein BDV97DRAFT_135760 [Delphinella strobiligena]
MGPDFERTPFLGQRLGRLDGRNVSGHGWTNCCSGQDFTGHNGQNLAGDDGFGGPTGQNLFGPTGQNFSGQNGQSFSTDSSNTSLFGNPLRSGTNFPQVNGPQFPGASGVGMTGMGAPGHTGQMGPNQPGQFGPNHPRYPGHLRPRQNLMNAALTEQRKHHDAQMNTLRAAVAERKIQDNGPTFPGDRPNVPDWRSRFSDHRPYLQGYRPNDWHLRTPGNRHTFAPTHTIPVVVPDAAAGPSPGLSGRPSSGPQATSDIVRQEASVPASLFVPEITPSLGAFQSPPICKRAPEVVSGSNPSSASTSAPVTESEAVPHGPEGEAETKETTAPAVELESNGAETIYASASDSAPTSIPGNIDPENVEPENIEPEIVYPEHIAREDVEPESIETEHIGPRNVDTESIVPESVVLESVVTESVVPESVVP